MSLEANDLQKEYKILLSTISPLVYHLNDPKDATHCLLWLTKLDEAHVHERRLRNKILSLLLENVERKKLDYPFTEDPFDGPLEDGFEMGLLTDVSIQPQPSIVDFSQDSEISKYRQRSKQHKNTISHYQSLIKSMIKSRDFPLDRAPSIPLLKLDDTPVCKCEEQTEVTKKPCESKSILRRIKNLESNTENLTIKYINAESDLEELRKTRIDTNISEKMAKKYKAQMLRIVNEKDKAITKLKEEINRQMSLDNVSPLEEVYRGKFNKLEKKYQQIVEDLIDKHSKERAKDRKTIESLQNRLAEK